MEVPPEVAIKATIRPGSVFYFLEDTLTSDEPHYFIVINIDPLTDKTLVLVCASSQISKVRRRRKNYPVETLVEITPANYADFKVNSIVDCNDVWEKTVSELVQKRSQGELQLKVQMETALIEKLRQGVLASQRVKNRIKTLLRK
ncbi:hypothetical protein M1O54_07920 [Dehalococcoidia bacterium]|nr:hypothetical protein [Dehalococcoidia bacterium]